MVEVNAKQGLKVPNLPTISAPNPEAGVIYFNTDDGNLKVSENGAVFVDLGTPASLNEIGDINFLGLGEGDIIYNNGTNWVNLAAGVDGQVLKTRGNINPPEWINQADLTPNGVVPIGTILPWHKSLTGVPTLPSNFAECNGQLLSDPQSPLDGQTMPDLNTGQERFLKGNLTSGGTGGVVTHTHQLNHFNFAGGSGSAQRWLNTSQNLNNVDARPPWFDVVWIIRTK